KTTGQSRASGDQVPGGYGDLFQIAPMDWSGYGLTEPEETTVERIQNLVEFVERKGIYPGLQIGLIVYRLRPALRCPFDWRVWHPHDGRKHDESQVMYQFDYFHTSPAGQDASVGHLTLELTFIGCGQQGLLETGGEIELGVGSYSGISAKEGFFEVELISMKLSEIPGDALTMEAASAFAEAFPYVLGLEEVGLGLGDHFGKGAELVNLDEAERLERAARKTLALMRTKTPLEYDFGFGRVAVFWGGGSIGEGWSPWTKDDSIRVNWYGH
ncbi:hypothetical protein R3X27_24865, partial [Tropicimonas sp. TH_r6]|uniref:hypothetical protein n=1 Tax=Tropicimonas sp. TH_r6 TaxID=3082085 RepID=UPI0029534FF7